MLILNIPLLLLMDRCAFNRILQHAAAAVRVHVRTTARWIHSAVRALSEPGERRDDRVRRENGAQVGESAHRSTKPARA